MGSERTRIMTGYELMRRLMFTNTRDRCIIKWWRKGSDSADYELLDRFLQRLAPQDEFEGFELLRADELWQELKRHDSTHVWVEERQGGPILHWQYVDSAGRLKEEVYHCSDQGLMTFFRNKFDADA